MKEVVQARLVDAMSTVAATMTMDEIHVGRKEFMRQVVGSRGADPGSNGLELENASLTSLNQTDIISVQPG